MNRDLTGLEDLSGLYLRGRPIYLAASNQALISAVKPWQGTDHGFLPHSQNVRRLDVGARER